MAISRENVEPDTPLTLESAATIAFPDGSVSGRTLAYYGRKGELKVWKIGRRSFTTLRSIEELNERCRERNSRPASCSATVMAGNHGGSSKMEQPNAALVAAKATLQQLKKSSQPTSSKNTDLNSETVVDIRSRSQRS